MSRTFFEAPRWKEGVRHRINEFAQEAARETPPGARVLDAGAGEGAYGRYFTHARYETADLAVGDGTWDYSKVTYRCELTRIPVEDGRFDAVLCTQTLEHVPDPFAVTRELARVLRSGGTLWVSVPFGSPVHQEPHDYWRYTHYGLRRLLEESEFRVEWIRPCGGYFQKLNHELSAFVGQVQPGFLLKWAVLPFFVVLRFAFHHLDRFDLGRRYTQNYVARATKR